MQYKRILDFGLKQGRGPEARSPGQHVAAGTEQQHHSSSICSTWYGIVKGYAA
jgi:hypothetical protein